MSFHLLWAHFADKHLFTFNREKERKKMSFLALVTPIRQTYCVCLALPCSCACWCSPCWPNGLHSVVDWGHRPHRRRWRIPVRETWRKGWRRRRWWRRSLTWTNASCPESGSSRPALTDPRRSDWNRQARLGVAGCPPCLLWREIEAVTR